MNQSRRAFVGWVGGGVAAALTGCVGIGGRQGAGAAGIIDTHQHVWDLKRFRLAWLDAAGERLNRSFSVEDYKAAAAGLGVAAAIYVEVNVANQQRDEEADYVAGLCEARTSLTVGATIAGDLTDDEFLKRLGRYRDRKVIKGVRSGFAKGLGENRSFLKGVQRLGELGMRLDVLANQETLDEAVRTARACKGTTIILDHCGNADVKWYSEGADDVARRQRTNWEKQVAALAECGNVVCKISGVAESGEEGKITPEALAPVVDFAIDRFGEDRVMFGSNWPVVLKTSTFAEWVKTLGAIVRKRGEAFGRKLFHDNARRVYGIAE